MNRALNFIATDQTIPWRALSRHCRRPPN